MRRVFFTIVALAAGGCSYRGDPLPPAGFKPPIELRLEKTPQGGLAYCDDAGRCSVVPNPNGCETLVVEVNPYDGGTCETCFGPAGETLLESCGGTSIACTVVTAPEPDCVVCAHVGGSVVFSDCLATAPDNCVYYEGGAPLGEVDGAADCLSDPDCPEGTSCREGLCLPDCRVCYDENGRPVLTECRADCGNLGCPEVNCGPGYEEHMAPGECCPRCVPVASCEEVVCPMEIDLPDCPFGSALVRDPADCCHYYCELKTCPPGGPLQVDCPVGHVADFSFPNCGRCVPGHDPDRLCTSSDQCDEGAFCTVEQGECLPAPGCFEGACLDVCYGECRVRDCALDDPEILPSDYCEGHLVPSGVGPDGCPLPPTCVCDDGVVTYDGRCEDQCAAVTCGVSPPTCDDDEWFIDTYPYCCGACVPIGACLPGEPPSETGLSFGCPEVACAAGFHAEQGLSCCPVCVRDEEACSATTSCHAGEYCTTEDGVCDPPPDGGDGTTLCYGTCAPLETCVDSDDGVDPYTRGTIESADAATDDEARLEDHCYDEHSVVELYCNPLYEGSDQHAYGSSIIACPNGCIDGACK